MPPNLSSEEVGVLVVGASLAGLCATEAAARGGAETLLIDAAPEVGARPNPATLLMEPLWRRTGLPVPEGAVERELSGMRLGGPLGGGPLFSFRALHLDRRSFDSGFAERATQAGAAVRSGVRVVGVIPSGGVHTDAGPVRARVTVFADGAGSAVREVLPTLRNPREVAFGLDQLREAPGIGGSPRFEVRFGSSPPAGGPSSTPWAGTGPACETSPEAPRKKSSEGTLSVPAARSLEESWWRFWRSVGGGPGLRGAGPLGG